MSFSFQRVSQTRRICLGVRTKKNTQVRKKVATHKVRSLSYVPGVGKVGHIKKNCRVKLDKANIASTSEGDDQFKWEHCFSIEAIKHKQIQVVVNYANNKEEWIIDSECSLHVTENATLFSEMHDDHGDQVIVTADNSAHPVAK